MNAFVPAMAFIPELPDGFIDGDEFLGRYVSKPGMPELMAEARRQAEMRRSEASEYRVTLSSLRRRAGLSQQQLAERVGTKQPVISMYESGEREPSLKTLEALADALAVSFDELVPALKHG